jgi:hypothetical protein
MARGRGGAKSSKLKMVGGRLVSARSKTGHAPCSQAMSAWKTTGMTAAIAAILGKCRSMARQNRMAEAQQVSGKLAAGRGTWQRGEKAGQLRQQRASKIAAAATARKSAEPAKPGLGMFSAASLKGGRISGHVQPAVVIRPSGQHALPGDFGPQREYAAPRPSGAGFRLTSGEKSAPVAQPGLFERPRPITLKEQAAAHRAGKGTEAERFKAVLGRVRERGGRTRPAAVAVPADPSTHTEHAPGTVTQLNANLIHSDPERFQYKLVHGATGASGSLAGVRRYDPELAGVVQVWKDPSNGKVFVINGHNRLALAKQHGVDNVAVRFIHAKDAAEARATGALTNIAEGRGNAYDAAKFFKDTKLSHADLEAKGIPMRERVATEGLALSRLEEGLFRRAVVDQSIPLERAVVIGGSGLSHPEQRGLTQLVERQPKNKIITNEHLRELVHEVKNAPTRSRESVDLFGHNEEVESLALHKAKVQAEIKQRLGREKKLFGIVSKSKAAEELQRAGNVIQQEQSGRISREAASTLAAFDQLKSLSGPVSWRLNHAAERIHAGENPRHVVEETYRHVIKHIPEFLAGTNVFAA